MRKTTPFKIVIITAFAFLFLPAITCGQKNKKSSIAYKPLFPDLVFDGAAKLI